MTSHNLHYASGRVVGNVVRGVFAAAVLAGLVVGLPWALIHFIGWPLPDHVPTWDEIQAVLLTPMSTPVLLNMLACLCWIVWAAFTIDVIRCGLDAARSLTLPTFPSARPVRGLAAALIGLILVAITNLRTSTAPLTVPITMTAATHNTDTGNSDWSGSSVAGLGISIDAQIPTPPGLVQVTVTVQPCDQYGVYDSLWRIARRLYGDGARWPELYVRNKGVLQADGDRLTSPNLIRPGWTLTALVPESALPTISTTSRLGPQVTVSPTTPPVPSSAILPVPTSRTSPDHATTTPPQDGDSSETTTHINTGGLALPTGAYVATGLAAAVTAACALIWRRRRRHYRIGSGDRSDLQQPIAPIVRALRHAHDDLISNDSSQAPATAANPSLDGTIAVGSRDNRELVIELASTLGLGLTGPGTYAAARALLVHLLALHPNGIHVLIPEQDLPLLLESPLSRATYPSTLTVTPTVSEALDELEAEFTHRTWLHVDNPDASAPLKPLVLITTMHPDMDRRLQAILDIGSTLGIIGIILSHWRPGATIRVREDGTVAATSPNAAALFDSHLFTLSEADTTDLLTLLRHTDRTADSGPGFDGVLPSGNGACLSQSVDLIPLHKQNPTLGDASIETSVGRESQDLTVSPSHEDTVRPLLPFTNSPSPASELNDFVLAVRGEHAPSTATAVLPDSIATGFAAHLNILGNVTLIVQYPSGVDADVSSALTPKQREILVYLALHPDGVHRDALNNTIWHNSSRERPYNNLHRILSMHRTAIARATDNHIASLVVYSHGVYRLDPLIVSTDYQRLVRVFGWGGHGVASNRVALRDAVALYRGDLAADLTAVWLDIPRETVRRDTLDALCMLMREEKDPEQLLPLLERARILDPYNEGIYRDIIRTHATLGHADAIRRTMALLTKLLNEIGERPTTKTLNLLTHLNQNSDQGA